MDYDIDYNLLIQAEKIRYQSDFSGSHWLIQVMLDYQEQIMSPLRKDAYETVIRIAIKVGVKAAIKKSLEYPRAAGFPQYLNLEADNWEETCKAVLSDFDNHIKRNGSRFGIKWNYKDGD